ncbi:PKD1 protein, partial [Atractosteus spatula]|nr:PKD1 protein [Atractosteus spatula]
MKLLVCTLFLAAAVFSMKSQADGKGEFPDSVDVESTEDEKLSPPELPWETKSGKAWGNLRNHGKHSGSSEDRTVSLKGHFLVGRTSLTQRRWHSKHQGSRLIRSILGDAKCAYKNGAPERRKINAPSLEMDSHDHSQDRQPPPTGIRLWPSEILPALPCPQHCVCNHTAVNCSGAGLTEVPRAGSCPLHTEILDLSRNRITHLRPDAFADFKDLKKIKFGFNSYKYDCSVAWLKDWLAQGSLTVLDSEDVRCSQPSSAFDVLVNMLDSAVAPCADSFVSCVPNPHSLSDAVLLYLRCEPQVRVKKSCEALCRHHGYSHYALDPAHHCLCGTLAPPASVQAQACSGVCSNIVQTVVCGRTIIHTAFPVLVSLEIVTAPWHSVYQPVELSVSAALPVFQWEFGDGSRPYNTTNTRVLYKYALPGTYKVDVHAMMGGYQLSLSVFVKVVMPLGQVQLEYPLQAETLNTLNFLVHIDRGTDLSAMWSVKDTRGKETTVHSICPRGSRIHLINMHCYWLVQTQESWQDARRTCQQTTGGDLAIVSSADIQSFLQQTFPLTDNVWIGLRDGTSVKPVWVDGAPADVFHNWGNANKNQKGCVQMMMSLMGLWKSTDCGTKIPFICEKHTSALLPGPDTFLAGVPVMTGVYKVNNLSVRPAPPGLGQSNVEVMLFPGLWFSHAGRVVSVEFVIQPIKNQTRARVQVLRPYCSPSQHLVPPGCSVLLNPFACCSTEPLCNTTGGCARGQQWCHLQDSCQPLSSPCSSYTPQGQSFGRPPRHTATPPFYHLVADLPLSLPHSSEQVHVNVLLLKQEINVFPDDILAVQHDAGAGSFLQCPRSDDSPWRQSYLSLRRTGWLEGGVSAQPSQSVWVDEVVCDLRVLYSDSLQGYAVTSPLGTGHRDPGSYTYSIAVSNPVSSTTACCTVDVRTPVWGLQIIHPLPVGGMIHIPVNKPTLIVIKILSGVNATSSWSAPVLRSGIAFSSSCPSALLAYVPGCTRTTPDTWFSYAYATVALPVSQILNISVSNGVSAQNLSVVLQSHQEVQGLRMKPQGDRRMLVDVSQEFRASVRSGSSVTYTWVIDDLILFAYHGQTYSVVFRKPAVYNLKVTAENPVSSESLDVKLTADLMKPLEDPVFLSVAEVMAVNTSQVFVFRVKVDVSIGVTFRWDFGDDIPAVSHSFSPPYDADQRKQIYLQDSASHIYTQPGNYSVRVEVFNSYDRTEKAVLVMVQSPLSGLSLFLTPAYPAVNQDFELEALPRPSTYGVCYLWNFADGSKEIKECNSKVSHTFKTAGVYNVTVTANTTFNVWRSWMAVEVVERITGLKLSYNGPSELGTPTVLKGTVSSGTRLFWTFDMGDGHVFSNVSDASISYIYKSARNYSARITVDNPVSHAFQSISVEVYRLIIGGILPSGCFVARREVPFQALVSGKESAMTFHWIFGDGSPLTIVQGNSTAVHRYASPGIYYVNITAFSPVRLIGTVVIKVSVTNMLGSSEGSKELSVQEEVSEVGFLIQDVFIHQPLEFWVLVKEGSDLLYRWNFGDSRKTVVNRNSTAIHCYHTPGRYLAEVTIFNNVSNFTSQLFINIRKLECNVPKVDLIQGKPRILKSRPSYFEASVDLQRCTAYKAGYLWEAFWGPDCLEKDRKPLQNIDVTSLLLVLPKLTLEVGSYCLRFTAALQGTPLLQSKSVNITVLQSQLVALIKGGSHRVWAAQEDLLLDGSGSHDPDIVGGEDRDLQYFWSYAVQNATEFSLRPSILNNSSTFILSRFNLQPNALYVFTLTVFKAGKLPASTTQSVMVRLGRVLPVNIQCRSCSALSSYRVSHSVHVVLSGQCKGCSNETLYEWTAEGSHGEVLELNNVSTTTGNSFPDLVIRKGVLQNGVHYNFTLSATHPSKEFWGSASIILVPNYPPSGGICTLTPNSTIYLLETVVTYHCSGWMDEDGDLTQLIYTMHVEVCQHRYHQCHILTLYRGTKSTFSTLVPIGSTESSSFSHISVLIEVEDALGGKVIALNSTLTVLLPVFPVESQGMMEWLTNKSQSKLWDMTQQRNPQEVIPYSIALTSMLNQHFSFQSYESVFQIQNVNEWDRQDLIRIRSNITQVLTSLSMSTMHDVAQISSALAQCVAVPHEFVCGECQSKTLEATRKMIAMIEDKTVLGDDTPVSTGTNVLQILGGLMAAAGHSTDSSKIPEITASAFSLVGDLMRSLMRSRVPREEVLKLTAPEIRVMGHRSETADLMCTSPSSPCQFYIPKGLSNQLKEKREVVQILMKIDANLFSANPPISTELAAMEFSTPEGLPIPISNLSKENAIHVMLETQKGVDGTTALTINPQGSVNFTVKAIETNPKAGLFISFNFTLHPGLRPERSPMVRIFIDDHPAPSENQHLLSRDILLTSTLETSHVEETIFLSPLHNGTVWEYHVNISSLLEGQEMQASVCVFSSLCQYFSLEERRWSSQGLSSLNGSSLKTAHCLTKHLTVFGASLFVHHSALILLPPSEGPAQNHVVGIVCVILLVIYLATVLIAHKMDDIDITRVGTIPLCGQSGRYQYQVLVKTGWTRGSGTTAHVGISLYGLNKSGSRHLDREAAFQRNSLDVFQIETDANLGEVWKIRIWHDNTGLDPSWYLQYVIVWDKQTSNMFFFLVEDWLSVENETNEGMVEKEVLATCPQELLRFYRIFRTQLIRGIFDRHLWVSVWERLPRSRFTRTQRVTCCALTLFLYLGVGAVWYGAVGQRNSSGPVSAHMLVNAEIVAVGMTVAALVFPIQLLFIVLFRMTRSKVMVEDPESCVAAPQTVEIDVCLEHSELGSSSFLSLPGGLDSILDGVSESSESLESRRSESSLGIPAKQEHESSVNPWASCDSIFDIPDLLASEPSLNRARILKRKKALLQLSIETPASSADDPLVLSWSKPEVTQGLEQNQLTVSEEDLIKSIAADNVVQSTSSSRVTSDSGRYSPCADTELSDPLESSCSGWSEFSDERKPYSGRLHKTSSSISGLTSASSFIPSPSPASVCSLFSTRLVIDLIAINCKSFQVLVTGEFCFPIKLKGLRLSKTRSKRVPRRAPRRLFPPQVLSLTYLLAVLVIGSSLAVAVLYGTTFHNSVVLMWLISTFSAFLTSAVLLEPAKVIVQSLFLALVMKPVDPDEDDTLVEEPVVKKVSERISKVRPPCGYGLLQAKEEARKVRALRTLMKSCIAHMVFLLVVLVVNYQDRLQGSHGRLLHSAVKRSLVAGSGEGMNVSMIRGAAEAWCWMQRNLVPHLYQNPSLQLLGVARLRRLQSEKGCWNHGIAGLTSRDVFLHPTVHAWPNTHTWDLNFHQNISSNHRQPFPSNSFMWLWYLGQFGVYSSEEEVVDLGNSTESTRQLLAELSQASWINTMTRGVFVQFTQYHRDTGLFVVVTVLMEWHQPGSAITSLSILPVCMPSSSSVPDLQAVMMVVLLLLALSILGSELHTLSTERCLYFRQGWHYLQLLVVLLALGVAALHFAFLSLSASLLRHHRHNRHSFTNFHTAVALSEASSSLSAILLTILILKNVRQLRFVRRWAVFGKTIQLVWKELCGASLVLLLLFLILAQTGYLLFSDTVEEFRTFGWTCFSLASGLWGKTRLGIVAHRHPISGLLYLLTVLGGLMWVLRWLFGTVLIQSYRAIQTEMYRPSMGPQDYEMVEFFIKRFKLWIGISKTKEFRHKVKFEGMESLPSRSSHDSKMSEPVSCGLDPTRLGSALSLGSEDSSVSESSHSEDYDVCFYMDRLLPTVNNLLAQFDRVNKVIEDLYQIEVNLQKAQRQISEKRKQRKKSLIKQPTTAPPHLLPSLPPLSTVSGTLRLPRTHTTFSESALSRLRPHCSQVSDLGLFDNCVPVRRPSLMDTGVTRVPGRRAWNSGPSLSADITQRPYPPAGSTVRDRPKSEEGKRGQRSDQAPVKRRAWHHDGT